MNTRKITFEFPEEEYPYLKMVCAKKRISIREFATTAIIKAIEEYEDELLTKEAEKRLNNAKKEDFVDIEKVIEDVPNKIRKNSQQRIQATSSVYKRSHKRKDL